MSVTDRTTAKIDHLLTYVKNLDEACALFVRMGFTLSPVSHIESMGISNCMVLMRPGTKGQANFVELMSPHDRSLLPPPMMPVLSGKPGIGSLVLASDVIDTLYREITTLGFDIPPPAHVVREWKIPGEHPVYPEFDILLPVDCTLRFNACRYYNMHLYLRPDWTTHPNGAIRVSRVYARSAVPAEFEFFERLFGRPAISLGNAGLGFPSGDISLEVLDPAGAKTRFGTVCDTDRDGYLGYEIQVESIERMRSFLMRGDVPFHEIGGTLCVAPDIGLGNVILFSQA